MKYWKIILTAILLLSLASCKKPDDSSCLDPDDFGFPKVTISALGQNVSGSPGYQVSEWTDSGYKINGTILVLKVMNYHGIKNSDRWYPWFSKNGVYFGDTIMQSTPKCSFNNGNMCADPSVSTTIVNPPCYLEQGVGLYGLITDPSVDTSPNVNASVERYPAQINAHTFHMGDTLYDFDYTSLENNTGYSSYQGAQVLSGGYLGMPPSGAQAPGKLYFKILDTYYQDNSGSYTVVMKHGITNATPGPIATVVDFIIMMLQEATQRIYDILIKNTNFVEYVHAMLLLYVTVTFLLILMGMSEMRQSEFFKFVIKYSLVYILISDTSWTFFHDYFFGAAMGGLSELTGYFLQDIVPGAGADWTFFDDMLGVLFSKEVNHKIIALFFSKQMPVAIIIIPILYIIVIIFAIAIIRTAVEWMFAMIAIGLLIVLFPIYLTFMLFKTTQQFWDMWLKQLGSYFLQGIIAIITLGFFASIVMHQFYLTLGFGVCWKTVFSLFGTDFGGWTPAGLHLDSNGDLLTGPMWIPETYVDNNDVIHVAYSGQETRYIDFPFMVPGIDDFKKSDYLNGLLVTLFDTFVFLVISYLFLKFMSIMEVVSNGIAGTPIRRVNLGNMVTGLWGSAKGTLSMAMKMTPQTRKLQERLGKLERKYSPDALEREADRVIDRNKARFKRAITPKPIRNFLDNAERGRENSKFNQARYGVGAAYDQNSQQRQALKDHALNKMSFGILGKDAHNSMEKDPETGLRKQGKSYYEQMDAESKKQFDNIDKNIGYGAAAIATANLPVYLGYKAGQGIFKLGKMGVNKIQKLRGGSSQQHDYTNHGEE